MPTQIAPNTPDKISKDKPRTYTLDQIKEINAQTGHYFFSPGANKFFGARYLDKVYQGPGGVFFVHSRSITTSDRVKHTDWRVGKFDPETGSVDHATPAMDHREDAKAKATDLAAGIALSNRPVEQDTPRL